MSILDAPWVITTLEYLCNLQFGNSDFVATVIAVAFATEYWEPIKGRIKTAAKKRNDERIEVLQVISTGISSGNYNTEVVKELESLGDKIEDFDKKMSAKEKKVWRAFKKRNFKVILISFFILFTGFTHPLNFLLIVNSVILLIRSKKHENYLAEQQDKFSGEKDKLLSQEVVKTAKENMTKILANNLNYKEAQFAPTTKYGGQLVHLCEDKKYLKSYTKQFEDKAKKDGLFHHMKTRIEELDKS